MLNISQEQLDQIVAREESEVARRVHRYRGDRPPVGIEGRTVILVDDGLATGFTARAAIEVVRRLGARRISWRSRWRPRRPSSNFEPPQRRRSGSRPRITSLASGSSTWTSRRPRTRRWRHSWQVPQPPFPEPSAPAADPPTSAEVVVGPVHLPGILDRAGASGGDRGLRAWQRQQQVEPPEPRRRPGAEPGWFRHASLRPSHVRGGTGPGKRVRRRAARRATDRCDEVAPRTFGRGPPAHRVLRSEHRRRRGPLDRRRTAARRRRSDPRGGRPTWRHAGSPTCSHRRC